MIDEITQEFDAELGFAGHPDAPRPQTDPEPQNVAEARAFLTAKYPNLIVGLTEQWRVFTGTVLQAHAVDYRCEAWWTQGHRVQTVVGKTWAEVCRSVVARLR